MKLIFCIIVFCKFVSRRKSLEKGRMVYAFNFAPSYSQYFAKDVFLPLIVLLLVQQITKFILSLASSDSSVSLRAFQH
jgi:hypothetical protein